MYQAHFGLQELPFGLTPDTSFAYTCASHQEALNTLVVAVKNGEGFIKITGEVGTGKTLLCRAFLAKLDDTFVSAYIPNPYLQPRALLLALAEELHVELPKEEDQHQLVKRLTEALLGSAAARRDRALPRASAARRGFSRRPSFRRGRSRRAAPRERRHPTPRQHHRPQGAAARVRRRGFGSPQAPCARRRAGY